MKQPTLCQRKRRNSTTYYCELNGKQHGLGTDREQAEILFAELLRNHHAREELAQPAKALTVRTVLFDFLKWVKEHRAEGTYLFYLQPIAGSAKESKGFVSFDAYLTRKGKAELLVADFGPQYVEGWITDHFESKSATYRHNLIRAIQAAFNWSLKRKQISENPLAGLEKPAQTAREAYLTDEQWGKIMAVVDGNFRDFLEILRETGCRPQEARVVTAEHFQRDNKRWFFPDPPKKVPGEKEPRIVQLNPRALEICQRLALKNPTGPLFVNDDGTAWQKNTLTARCARLKTKLGFGFCVYSIRHAFCTAALKRKVDPLSSSLAQLRSRTGVLVSRLRPGR